MDIKVASARTNGLIRKILLSCVCMFMYYACLWLLLCKPKKKNATTISFYVCDIVDVKDIKI